MDAVSETTGLGTDEEQSDTAFFTADEQHLPSEPHGIDSLFGPSQLTFAF